MGVAEPAEVWRLIERADELAKYAPNRDAAAAHAQARAALDRAEALARALADPRRREHFEQQIALRRDDLDRYDSARDAP